MVTALALSAPAHVNDRKGRRSVTGKQSAATHSDCGASSWVRGPDLNRRPSGYEPDELPDCSTPRRGEADYSQGLRPVKRRGDGFVAKARIARWRRGKRGDGGRGGARRGPKGWGGARGNAGPALGRRRGGGAARGVGVAGGDSGSRRPGPRLPVDSHRRGHLEDVTRGPGGQGNGHGQGMQGRGGSGSISIARCTSPG